MTNRTVIATIKVVFDCDSVSPHGEAESVRIFGARGIGLHLMFRRFMHIRCIEIIIGSGGVDMHIHHLKITYIILIICFIIPMISCEKEVIEEEAAPVYWADEMKVELGGFLNGEDLKDDVLLGIFMDYERNGLFVERVTIDFLQKTWEMEECPLEGAYFRTLEDNQIKDVNVYHGFQIVDREKVYFIRSHSMAEYVGGEQMYESELTGIFIECYELTGKQISSLDVTDVLPSEASEFRLELGTNGDMCVAANIDENWELYTFKNDAFQEKVPLDNYLHDMKYIDNCLYIASAGNLLQLCEGKLEEILCDFGVSALFDGSQSDGFDLLFVGLNQNVYGMNLETNVCEPVLSLYHLLPSEQNVMMTTLDYRSKEEIYWANGDIYAPGTMHVYRAHPYEEGTESEGKTTLRCAQLSDNPIFLAEAIVEFNQNNTAYYIEVTDFSEKDEPMIEFKNRIAAGEVYDLVEFTGFGYDSMLEKELLKDLYPYLTSDGTMTKEDIQASPLRALLVDGALYEVTPLCYLDTYCVNRNRLREVTGKEDTWTREDYVTYLRDVNPQAPADELLMQAMSFSLSSYVDVKQRSCSFTTDEFYRLLEACQRSDEQEKNKTISDEKEMSDAEFYEKYGFLRLYLYPMKFCEVLNYKRQAEEMLLIGYPSSNQAVVRPAMSVGMMSCSQYQDAAWSFLAEFLDVSYQQDKMQNYEGFMTGKGMTEAELQMLHGEGFEAQYAKNRILGEQFEEDVLMPLTEEELTEIRDMIGDAQRAEAGDPVIMQIISEESQSYFAGQKSAEDVAALIQNRVSVYLAER